MPLTSVSGRSSIVASLYEAGPSTPGVTGPGYNRKDRGFEPAIRIKP